MSIYDTIKIKTLDAMKSGDTATRDTLKTLSGEIQSKSISLNKPVDDEMTEKILIFFKENAIQCLGYIEDHDSEAIEKANVEISLYESFLPQYASVEEIVELLQPNVEQIKSAKADGPATGMAMGILKKSGVKIQGKDVSEAVKQIRG